jgi:hypothetical protein
MNTQRVVVLLGVCCPAGRAPADEASQQFDALGIVYHLGQGVQPARLNQR